MLVIDGQRRLTTVMLVDPLARSQGEASPLERFSATKLRAFNLLTSTEDGERRYKLLLSRTGKASLVTLLDGHPRARPEDRSVRVDAAFGFKERAAEVNGELASPCNGNAAGAR